MTALLWQTTLLLVGAYFLGSFTGCLIRRTFFAAVPAQPVQPQSEVPPAPPRRLPDPEPISVPAAALAPAGAYSADVEIMPVHRQAASAEGTVAAASTSSARPAAASGGARPLPPVAAPARPAAAPPAAAPWAPTPPATPSPRVPGPAPAAPQARAPEADRPQPPLAERPALPGRSIGTSAAAAAALAAAAARHQAAQRTERVEQGRPGLPAASGTTGLASTSAPIAHAPATPPPQATAAAVASPAEDDLTRIRGIDPELQGRLNGLGVRRFSEIAGWRKDEIRRISEALGFRGRIEQENWIEQAQILMSGSETAFSRRRHSGGQPLAKPNVDEGERRVETAKPRPDAAASALAAAVASSVAAAPRRPNLALGRDNLQRISRISEDEERLLNVQGVSRYDQIGRWTSSDVSRFERLLNSDGRISHENWIEQAQILARGGETAYAREFDRQHAATVPAPPRPTQLAEAIRTAQQPAARKVDLTALRSVRSEAFRGADAGGTAVEPAARADDLKRIRGIGVLIEKRLINLGYRSYEQVANWTAADVDRVSQALDFRGRIERENWVEQARILASGGQTDFARRLDRSELEKSRGSN